MLGLVVSLDLRAESEHYGNHVLGGIPAHSHYPGRPASAYFEST
jgi:hypothetical protein